MVATEPDVGDDGVLVAGWVGGVIPVRDDDATTVCPICGRSFVREGRQRFCGTRCRQTAWRRGREAPVEPTVAKADTVYQCPGCENRYLGVQRCDDCNTWCVRLGPGGLCPCCEEPVALNDIVARDQFAGRGPGR